MEDQAMIPPANLIGQQLSDHARIEQLEKKVEELRQTVYGDFNNDVPAIRAMLRETNRKLNQLQMTGYVTIAAIITYILLNALSQIKL